MYSVEAVINFMCEKKLTLATAESCTAGMVTSLLADVPGCGSILDVGYVVYTEHAKHACLGVNLQTIKIFGLTSEEVAIELALGALDRSNADIAIAVTGTAESNDHLNGVVCFAYALRGNQTHKFFSETIKFEGERNSVRKSAALHVISSIPSAFGKLISRQEVNS